MTQVRTVARVLLDADDWMLTSDIAATANMLDKPTHVSAILNNLRARDFLRSEKGGAGSAEQQHRVFEPNRATFIAWVDRDNVAPPTRDAGTKKRASEKSAQQHRIDLATKPTLAQMASAAERGTVPRTSDINIDELAKAHGGVEHRVIKPAAPAPLSSDSIGKFKGAPGQIEPLAKLSIREFYDAVTKVLGIPPTWTRVCIAIERDKMPIIVADLEPPAILLGVK